jgi:hypothetical protein
MIAVAGVRTYRRFRRAGVLGRALWIVNEIGRERNHD